MSKSILQSIKPQYCELIASGKKTIEVRKTKPKLDVPFKVYVYETAGRYKTSFETTNPCISVPNGGKIKPIQNGYRVEYFARGKGKVIGEYVCDEIQEFTFDDFWNYYISDDDLVLTCLTQEELFEYGNGKTLYGYHISDLKIYDKPRELSEFEILCKEYDKDNPDCESCDYQSATCDCDTPPQFDCKCNGLKPITRPPQSFCYVEEV